MKTFIYGKLLKAEAKEVKNGTMATVVEIEVTGWDKEKKAETKSAKSIWYFATENAPLNEWALEAAQKAVGKTVLLTAEENDGKYRGYDVPGTYKLVTIPRVLRKFDTQEEEDAAYKAFGDALNAVIEKGNLPEDYQADVSKAATLMETVELLKTIKDEDGKIEETAFNAVTAAYGLLTFERNAIICVVGNVIENEERAEANVAFALPSKGSDEVRWATATFTGDTKDRVLKVLHKGDHVVLFLGEAREGEKRVYFKGLNFRRI